MIIYFNRFEKRERKTMNGIWILLVLIFTAALPVIIVFFWFRIRKSTVTLPWFLVSFAAGIISLLAAALIQGLIPEFDLRGYNRPRYFFFNIFIRIALVEEASRLITLIPLLKAGKHRLGMNRSYAAALGFVAGLGFATLESALYGMADISITLLRIFTAAPLHGACGIRVSTAVLNFEKHPFSAPFLFITSVLIHGVYNLMIESPIFPSALAILVSLAGLITALPYITGVEMDDENHPS